MQLQSRHTTEHTEIYSIKHFNSGTHAEILFRNTSNIHVYIGGDRVQPTGHVKLSDKILP